MAAIIPFMKSQTDRLNNLEATMRHLKLRNDILEGGLSSIQTALDRSSPSPSPRPTNTNTSVTAFDNQTIPPTANVHIRSIHSQTPSPTSSNQSPSVPALPDSIPPAPFDSPTHHLLCLHESLRDEVSRISAALTDLDARSSMTLMNETLRLKDELAHTNAAVGSMRVQLHWLIGARLQQQRMMGSAPAVGGMGGGAAGPSVAGPSAGPSGGVGMGGPGRRSRSSDGGGGPGGVGGERTKL
jgi:hypothetical protein